MDDQLRTDNMPTILKLYESALSLPIRMRVGPTMKQIVLDTITYAEDIWSASGTTADTCLDFITKVRVIVDPHDKPQRQLETELKLANILYHGKAIGDQGVRCIQTVEPYAANGAVRAAARNLEPETKKLNEQTLMLKLCAACNKQYGKATTAAIDACVKVLVTLRFALKYKCNNRIQNDTQLTEEHLTGKTLKKAGFVQATFKKNQFTGFINTLVSHSNDAWAIEVRNHVFPKLLSISDMETAFVNNNGAAIGATASAASETDHMEESAPVDDDDNDNDYSERGNGLMNQAHEKSKYCETLTLAATACARLLFNTHSVHWYDEFLLIAEQRLISQNYSKRPRIRASHLWKFQSFVRLARIISALQRPNPSASRKKNWARASTLAML